MNRLISRSEMEWEGPAIAAAMLEVQLDSRPHLTGLYNNLVEMANDAESKAKESGEWYRVRGMEKP